MHNFEFGTKASSVLLKTALKLFLLVKVIVRALSYAAIVLGCSGASHDALSTSPVFPLSSFYSPGVYIPINSISLSPMVCLLCCFHFHPFPSPHLVMTGCQSLNLALLDVSTCSSLFLTKIAKCLLIEDCIIVMVFSLW